MTTILQAVDLVVDERHRQAQLWGVQHHSPALWLAILTEEVGELAQEVLRLQYPKLPPNSLDDDHERVDLATLSHMETETVHVAAVAVQIIEAIGAMRKTYKQGSGDHE